MTLQRTWPGGLGIGGTLTSADLNAIDVKIVGALDKRAGETDTLESVVSCASGRRVVPAYAAGADADTTYLVTGGNSTIDVSTLTADRAYTLSNTDAVAGDRLFILNRSNQYVTIKNAASATLIVIGSTVQAKGESTWADFLFTGAEWVLAKSAPKDLAANDVHGGRRPRCRSWGARRIRARLGRRCGRRLLLQRSVVRSPSLHHRRWWWRRCATRDADLVGHAGRLHPGRHRVRR